MTRRVTRTASALPVGSLPGEPSREVPRAANVTLSADEGARTRLIGDICTLLHEPTIPERTRSAGLELIGWLARRMPGEAPHALGVQEALQAKRAARRKVR